LQRTRTTSSGPSDCPEDEGVGGVEGGRDGGDGARRSYRPEVAETGARQTSRGDDWNRGRRRSLEAAENARTERLHDATEKGKESTGIERGPYRDSVEENAGGACACSRACTHAAEVSVSEGVERPRARGWWRVVKDEGLRTKERTTTTAWARSRDGAGGRSFFGGCRAW
jgi:hypothetical protein